MLATLKRLFTARMIVVFFMGFASGLPLLLIGSTLKARLKEAGVDLTVIGFFSLVGLPYTLKFLWSPFLDRFAPFGWGRRRGWLFLIQILLAASLVWMGCIDVRNSIEVLAVASFVVAFLSATQDILIDSYRRETLSNEELGWGSSLAINGYRIALLFSGALALHLADNMDWRLVYFIMAASVSVGFVTTLFCSEPKVMVSGPQNLRSAFVEPFLEFFRRPGSLLALAFVIFYKLGDSMASDMTVPYFLDLGFTKTEIGAVAKLFGFWATIIGGLLGGAAILRLGIPRALWIFGILQAVTILGFALLSQTGANTSWLAAVVTFENATSGMATAAYAAFMASLTDRRFTATQYALLSSLMGIPRVIASAPTGWLAKNLGWPGFFVFCTFVAIPGMVLLWFVLRDSKLAQES